jgi:hypothetical protein
MGSDQSMSPPSCAVATLHELPRFANLCMVRGTTSHMPLYNRPKMYISGIIASCTS